MLISTATGPVALVLSSIELWKSRVRFVPDTAAGAASGAAASEATTAEDRRQLLGSAPTLGASVEFDFGGQCTLIAEVHDGSSFIDLFAHVVGTGRLHPFVAVLRTRAAGMTHKESEALLDQALKSEMYSTAVTVRDPSGCWNVELAESFGAPSFLLGAYDDAAGVAAFIKERDARRIIVMVGAGMSCAAGIPDFRTPGTGLYDNLAKYNLPYPEAVFTLGYLKEKPEVFYAVAKDMKLWPGHFAPTVGHHFINALHRQGRLLRCFTQNIDSLERLADLPAEALVEAHGTFATASCANSSCKAAFPVSNMKECVDRGEVPRCPTCNDVAKPDVVFFGEQLPLRFHQCLRADAAQADLLLIIGTSLKVFPFASIPDLVGEHVPRVLINMSRVGDFLWCPTDRRTAVPSQTYRDSFLGGDCQAQVMALAEALGIGAEVAEAHKAGLAAEQQRLGRGEGATL